jgi:hypothetical protein
VSLSLLGLDCESQSIFTVTTDTHRSYRIAIWTRNAPEVSLTEEDELMSRIMTIGRHFKTSVLGYEPDQKLVSGGFQTEVTFESHKGECRNVGLSECC